MAIEILMPALSPTMEEGTLAKWLVKEGDTVKSGQILAEIETDKATMEFEAVDEGIVGKFLVAEGTAGVKVNTPIAVLLDEGEKRRCRACAASAGRRAAAAAAGRGGGRSRPPAAGGPGSAGGRAGLRLAPGAADRGGKGSGPDARSRARVRMAGSCEADVEGREACGGPGRGGGRRCGRRPCAGQARGGRCRPAWRPRRC